VKPLTVMLVAGEASGDALGAGLAAALKKRLGDKVRFVGVGGARMAEYGVQSPFDIAELSILGMFDGLMAYGRVKRRVADTVALAVREEPDVAVLIDSWGFTVRVAKGLREALPGIKLVKYVGPQVWAARPGRAKTLAQAVDHLLTIHSFDAPLFEAEGLKTTFVGNSALMTDFSHADGSRFRKAIGAGVGDPILLVLPGSRPSEVKRLTPVFEGTLKFLKRDRHDLHVVVVAADTVAETVRAWTAGLPFRAHLVESDADKHDAMKAATVALACSGTVSIELALAGTPMVIAYRLDPITYLIALRLIRTPWITLFNVAARDRIAPEFVQDDASPANLAEALARRLDDPALRKSQVERQNAALDLMGRGQGDPSERAADAVLDVVGRDRA
jgi:lipid-A-disaccharide synthase